MDNQMEIPTSEVTFESLNEDCILHIYKFLQLDDSINLASTCHRLRNYSHHKFKKYSNLELDSTMMKKGNKYVGPIFFHIGTHLTSLKIYGGLGSLNLCKLFEVCKNLKSFRLDYYNWQAAEVQHVSSVNRLNNVELLTLNNCNFVPSDRFIETFKKLKFLNISSVGGEPSQLKDIFNNNSNIESVVCRCNLKDFQLFQLIPNVKRLCLDVRNNVLQLNSLLNLNQLTKLQLNCNTNNINSFLKEVASKEIMEEMDLGTIKVDDAFFNILQSFGKLKFLGISNIWTINVLYETDF